MNKYVVEEAREHVEGGDRGGYAKEERSFTFDGAGNATHEYVFNVYDYNPESFGVDRDYIERLSTKEEAIEYMNSEISALQTKPVEAEEQLIAASSYNDLSEYFEDEDEDPE